MLLPCGVPAFSGMGVVHPCAVVTMMLLCCRYASKNLVKGKFILVQVANMRLCGALSKAPATSPWKMHRVCKWCRASCRKNRGSKVDLAGRKPHMFIGNQCVLLSNEDMRCKTMDQASLDSVQTNVMGLLFCNTVCGVLFGIGIVGDVDHSVGICACSIMVLSL